MRKRAAGDQGPPPSPPPPSDAAGSRTSALIVCIPFACLILIQLTPKVRKGISIICAMVVIFVGTYFILRFLRKKYEPPSWFPTFLKNWFQIWPPIPSGSAVTYTRARAEDADAVSQPGVDRTQSVRSIMTLPEYRVSANPDKERTVAREGERGGMDVVIEFPETHEEEEARREQHMQTLYEVRLVRAADREERRARREARRRGERLPSSSSTSSAATARPRTTSNPRPPQFAGGGVNSLLNVEPEDPPRPVISPSVQAAVASRSASSIAALIAEPSKRLPQVGYADIGVVRPDGSRVRENSTSSDRRALLGDVATLATHSRQGSASSINTFTHAGTSATSLATFTTINNSNTFLPRTRRGSDDSFQFVQTQGRQSEDLTDMRGPPEYDSLAPAPAYDQPSFEIPHLTVTGLGPSGDLTSPIYGPGRI